VSEFFLPAAIDNLLAAEARVEKEAADTKRWKNAWWDARALIGKSYWEVPTLYYLKREKREDVRKQLDRIDFFDEVKS